MSKKKSDKKTQQEIKEALFQLELEKNRKRIKDHFQREREALDKRIEIVMNKKLKKTSFESKNP
tara:strand:- start:675 stop:866 length:192 start_codon:yes stop_codon:yes gene_type:complete